MNNVYFRVALLLCLYLSSIFASSSSLKVNLLDLSKRDAILSQKIVKAYLYKGTKVLKGRADRELNASIEEFTNNLKILNRSIYDYDSRNLLSFVKMSFDKFTSTIKKPFDLNNSKRALDLSQSLLESSQFLVESLKKSKIRRYASKNADLIVKSGEQRVLAQKIAKYYIAYQLGIKNENIVEKMRDAVNEFEKNQKELMANTHNDKQIYQKLKELDKLWSIVHRFYLGIKKGGLPFIVYKTTNDITNDMDEIIKLYDK